MKKLIRFSRGFTLIEVLVVVVVIGVLAAVTIVRYDDFQKSVIAAQLKSDLNGAAAAMENARTFNNAYPTTIPSTFTPSVGVALTGGSTDGKVYCIDASSSNDASIHYYIDQTTGNSGAQMNTCATRPIAPSIPSSFVATAANSTTINLSWAAVPGATTYTLQRDSNGLFSNPVTVATQAGTTVSSGSLVAVTRYYYRVKATNSYGDSTWSSSANAMTLAYSCADTGQYGTYPNCYQYDALPIATSISGYWSTAPDGYLLEDGSAVSRTTYSALFAAIGTTYGSGDGSTTFNLPDSRGRATVNKNSGDGEFDTIGEKYGEKAHTLTSSETGLISHNHSQNAHNHAQYEHSHGISNMSWSGDHQHGFGYGVNAFGGGASNPKFLPDVTHNYTTTDGNHMHYFDLYASTASNNANTASNNATSSNASSAHNTIQPSIVKVFAIKYRPSTGSDSTLSASTSISGYWSSAPTGYLIEDGSAVSRTTYSALFSAIGTTYGSGDGSTTFNLPDSRGRVAVNKSTDTEFDVIGEKYGAKTVTLTSAQSGMPAHGHSASSGEDSPDHSHQYTTEVGGGRYSHLDGQGSHWFSTYLSENTSGYNTAHTHGVTVNNSGSDDASSSHNTIQPSIVKLSVIKHTAAAGSTDNSAKGTSISGYWSSAPTGYLLEDGSAVSRTTYSALFSAIGTTYGSGDGSTTFNLPDSRGRLAVNKNPSDGEFNTIGQKYGSKTHTLTSGESGLRDHGHSASSGTDSPDHSHTYTGGDWSGGPYCHTDTNGAWSFETYGANSTAGASTRHWHAIYVNNSSAYNAGSSHNNIQPSIVQNFAIRY